MKNKKILTIILLALIGLGTIYCLKSNSTLFKKQQFCSREKATDPQDSKDSVTLDNYNKCKPIAAYPKTTITNQEIDNSMEEIKKIDGVYYVEYVSSEMAASNINKSDPFLGQFVPKNVIPAVVRIYVSDPSTRVQVLEIVKRSNNFALVQ